MKPTVYRRGGGGAAVPRDSDGDGYSDIDEMHAGTDPNNPTDYPGKPVVTPTPTPTPTPVVTPTPTVSPVVTPTPTPKPPTPGFEAVFANFSFQKEKFIKENTVEIFLVKVFTEGKKVVGKAFL